MDDVSVPVALCSESARRKDEPSVVVTERPNVESMLIKGSAELELSHQIQYPTDVSVNGREYQQCVYRSRSIHDPSDRFIHTLRIIVTEPALC